MSNDILKESEVEWIVNELGELGVKIKGQFFFMYKGRSLEGSGDRYRTIYKREFGETCNPWHFIAIHQKTTVDKAVRPENYEEFTPGDDWDDQ
jgi:hypothetical protein